MRRKMPRRKMLLLMMGVLGFVASPSLAETTAPSFDRRSLNMLTSGPLSASADRVSAFAVTVDLWVDPSGKIYKCSSSLFAGEINKVDEVCASYEQVKLVPAKNHEDEPTFGRLITMLKIVSHGQKNEREVRNATTSPDVEIVLNKFPEGSDGPYNLSLDVAVDEQGNVAECDGSPEIAEVLKKIVCSRIEDGNFGVMTSQSGQAVPYVTNLSARFTSQAQ